MENQAGCHESVMMPQYAVPAACWRDRRAGQLQDSDTLLAGSVSARRDRRRYGRDVAALRPARVPLQRPQTVATILMCSWLVLERVDVAVPPSRSSCPDADVRVCL